MIKILSTLLILSMSLFARIDTEAFARWMVNSGDLFVEQGKYLEAIDAYDTAVETTENSNVKIDAAIRRANVLIFYLNKKREAKRLLLEISKKYPKSKQSEYALYNSAMLEKDFDIASSVKLFRKYLNRYPNGKYSFQAKYFIRQNSKIVKKKRQKYKESHHFADTIQKKQDTKAVVKKKKLPQKKIPNIRVLLKKNLKKVTLKGKLVIDNKILDRVNVFYKHGYILYNGQRLRKLVIKSNSPIYIDKKKRSYFGSVLLLATKSGIKLINIVDMKHYIYGVVTSESYNSWNMEALKAQAVASRTYAYYQTLVRKNWSYDVRDNTFDQVYKGINGITKRAKNATNATLGEIIYYKDSPILAQYTANSGWYSSSSKEIFNTDLPYLHSHKDNFSAKMPYGKWKKKISAKTLEKNLRRLGIKVFGIKDIKPELKTKSGRIVKLRIVAKNGEIVLRAYSSIRKAANLKDILMNIKKRGDTFYFLGGGYGHGVGYSQWGSQAMAKEGYDYKKILEFYYKNCHIRKLWGI